MTEGEVFRNMDGAICRKMDCHLCCLETAMELTFGDIERLEAAGKRDFVTEDGTMRNKDGRCIFLDRSGLCSIYFARPKGCDLYPLTMRLPDRVPVMDRDCPHRALFKPDAEDIIALEDIVRELEVDQ